MLHNLNLLCPYMLTLKPLWSASLASDSVYGIISGLSFVESRLIWPSWPTDWHRHEVCNLFHELDPNTYLKVKSRSTASAQLTAHTDWLQTNGQTHTPTNGRTDGRRDATKCIISLASRSITRWTLIILLVTSTGHPYTMPLMIHIWHMVTENCLWRKILKCCAWCLILKCCAWCVISKHWVWRPPDASQTQHFEIRKLRLAGDFEMWRLTCDFNTLRLTSARHNFSKHCVWRPPDASQT